MMSFSISTCLVSCSKNSATASRLIKEAVEDGAIVAVDEGAAKKLMKYTPRWAQVPKSERV